MYSFLFNLFVVDLAQHYTTKHQLSHALIIHNIIYLKKKTNILSCNKNTLPVKISPMSSFA